MKYTAIMTRLLQLNNINNKAEHQLEAYSIYEEINANHSSNIWGALLEAYEQTNIDPVMAYKLLHDKLKGSGITPTFDNGSIMTLPATTIEEQDKWLSIKPEGITIKWKHTQ